MKALCKLLGGVLVAALVVAVLGTAIFIGIGALLTHWLPISLFQAAILAIGATVAVTLIVYTGATMVHFYTQQAWHDDDDQWEPDDEPEPVPDLPDPNRLKIGRNAPCPCNSGKKYKNCCGRSPGN